MSDDDTGLSPGLPISVPSQLWQAGMKREDQGIRQLLSLHFADLLDAAGVPPLTFGNGTLRGFGWCALNLPRDLLFDDGSDGDIDILAGPLEPAFSYEELVRHEQDLVRRLGPGANALDDLIQTRGVIWPPRNRMIVGLEAKASWYGQRPDEDARTGAGESSSTWRGTHTSSKGQRRIGGQLRYLANRADFVSFLLLGATRPRGDSAGNPWFEAGVDVLEAEMTMGEVTTDVSFGYISSIVGAVGDSPEFRAGVGSRPQVHREPTRLPRTETTWRDNFWKKLEALSAPTSLSPVMGVVDGELRWEAPVAWALGLELPDPERSADRPK